MFNDYIKCIILYHYIIKETKVELTVLPVLHILLWTKSYSISHLWRVVGLR